MYGEIYGDGEPLAPPTLGEYVRMRRRAAGLTQEGLAKLAHTHKGYIAKIEQGDRAAAGETVVTGLGSALDLGVHEMLHLRLLAGHPQPGRPMTTDDVAVLLSALDPHPAAIVRAWRVTASNAAFRDAWPGLATAPSMLNWMYEDARADLVTPDWETEAVILTGLFRHSAALPEHKDAVEAILESLRANALFHRHWTGEQVYAWRPDPRQRVFDPRTETTRTLVMQFYPLLVPPDVLAALVVGLPDRAPDDGVRFHDPAGSGG
ncbi:helix-turn-helix domain-containing protein [Nocardia sp. NPDC048505]|uniref:MmyB family transcriptional regulator n=1 Tax=unclassified Nocardia TaxID=2637762 RepID=UPI0033C3C500